jgi:hypothetical protein
VNSQQFLLLNIAILLFFIIWFFAGRRGSSKKTTQLQMKRGNTATGGILQQGASKGGQGRYSHPRYHKYIEDCAATDRGPADCAGKDLNVLFNYNGHTWDAYEVLGIPAGASLVDVTKAYQHMLKSSAPESHEFLETAFKAILAKK